MVYVHSYVHTRIYIYSVYDIISMSRNYSVIPCISLKKEIYKLWVLFCECRQESGISYLFGYVFRVYM